jgi:hypothetical protein
MSHRLPSIDQVDKSSLTSLDKHPDVTVSGWKSISLSTSRPSPHCTFIKLGIVYLGRGSKKKDRLLNKTIKIRPAVTNQVGSSVNPKPCHLKVEPNKTWPWLPSSRAQLKLDQAHLFFSSQARQTFIFLYGSEQVQIQVKCTHMYISWYRVFKREKFFHTITLWCSLETWQDHEVVF